MTFIKCLVCIRLVLLTNWLLKINSAQWTLRIPTIQIRPTSRSLHRLFLTNDNNDNQCSQFWQGTGGDRVPGTGLHSVWIHFFLPNLGTITDSILQMRKLRHRESKWLAQRSQSQEAVGLRFEPRAHDDGLCIMLPHSWMTVTGHDRWGRKMARTCWISSPTWTGNSLGFSLLHPGLFTSLQTGDHVGFRTRKPCPWERHKTWPWVP